MSKLTNKYLMKSVHKMIVDSLTEDGVVCNYNNKTYDELATYEGGSGHRKAFTNYNERIKAYHNMLSTLIGEKRADIYESIPVIDFLNIENTSLASTYLTTNNKDNPIDSTTILDSQLNDYKPALELIEEDDPYTINRAILGYNVAEHFFNTTSQNASCTSIQVSPYVNEYAYMYKGIYLPRTTVTEITSNDIRRTELLCYQALTGGTLTFNPDNSDSEYKKCKVTTVSGKTYLYDPYNGIVLNTSCGRKTGPTGGSQSYTALTDELGTPLVSYDSTADLATLNVSPQDIIIVIPTTVYSSSPNKMIYLKASDGTVGTKTIKGLIGSYNGSAFTLNATEYNPCNSNFYYVDQNRNVYQYSDLTGKYNIVEKADVKNFSSNARECDVEISDIYYTYEKYIAYIEDYDSEFTAEFTFQEIPIDTEVPSFLRNAEILRLLAGYIRIDKEYYAKASGLLDGYYCEPYSWDDSGDARTIKKWKFINESDAAAEYGISIDIGAKYNPSHILYRGDMIESPLKLTSHDSVTLIENGVRKTCTGPTALHKKGIYGKAYVYYNNLIENDEIFSKTFKSIQLDRNAWMSYNRSPVRIESLVNKFDYTDVKMNSFDAVSLSGKANPYADGSVSKMKYKNKFMNSNEVLSADRIEEYFNLYYDCIQGDTLNLHYNKPNVLISHNTFERKYKWISNSTRRTGSAVDYSSDLESTPMVAFTLNYDKIKKKNSNDDDVSFTRPRLSVLTPFDLFLKSGQNVDTILLYPEYADRFPETLYILSKKELDFEEYKESTTGENRGACFLYANGKYLMFSVNRILDCRLSKLKKLRVIDEQGTYTTDFPFEYYSVVHKDDELRKLMEAWDFDYIPYFGTGADCWIYAISPLNASFEAVALYDENDNLIPAATLDMANGAIGASYPDNYFKVTKKESNGSIIYALESSNRQADMANLANSSIFVSLPKYSSPADLKSYTRNIYNPQRGFVSAFASMISNNNSALKSSMKKVFNSLLENWKLSDSDVNPIHLKDVSGLVSNIKDFALNITNLVAKSEFKIVINDKYRALKEEDFKGLLTRIDDNRAYDIYSYIVERNNSINVDDFYEECPIPDPLTYQLYTRVSANNYKRYEGDAVSGTVYYRRKWLAFEKIDDSRNKAENDKNTYYLPKDSEHVYLYNPDQFYSYPDLPTGTDLQSYYIKTELRDAAKHFIKSQLQIKKVPTNTSKRRFSYNRIKKMMDNVFVDGEFSKSDCESIDLCFGDDAEPVLVLSEDMNGYQIPSAIKDKISVINDIVINITKDAAQSIIAIEQADKFAAAVDAFKKSFVAYYTSSSVDAAIDDRGNINWNLFKVDLSKSQPKSILSDIKNNAVSTSLKLGIWPSALGLFMSLAWRFANTDAFINKYRLNTESTYGLKALEKTHRSWLLQMLNAQVKKAASKIKIDISSIKQVTYDEVRDYYTQSSAEYVDSNNFNIEPNADNSMYEVKVISPNFNDGYGLARGYNGPLDDSNHVVKSVESSIYPTTVSEDVLKGLAEFAKTALEGTDPDGENSYYVKYLAGDDKPSGRENSLYYKRYNILNTRMNMIQGPLYKAASYVKNTKIFEDIQNLNSQTLETYDKFVTVMPVAEMEGMTYLPPQKASATTIELDGKYYSDKELEALRNQINSACVLTCTRCSIKDSCPFYDQEEVIKLYCTGLETIDLWLKDNELELLDTDSFELEMGENGLGFDAGRFKTMHLPYSDIVKKTNADNEVTYEVNDLNSVRKALKSQTETTSVNLNYKKYVQDDMGWLLGGRYGCVEKNTLKDVESTEYSNMTDHIYDYKYLYNALFIDVEGKDSDKDSSIPIIENDSYISYRPSTHRYEVSFDVGPAGDKKHYSGTTKIKIPTGIKLLNNAGNDDDLYLVSDDLKDPEGLDIVPIIYLGKANSVQFTFDLTDDGIPHGVISPNDTQLYAADVAQWCANYYKGWLAEDPIGYTGDNNKDRDQYWMEKVYKKINGKWCQFDGRKRIASGYQEPVADPDNFDEIAAISGHPVVNTYVDFLRKVSIRMYDPYSDGTGKWLIPFVNPRMDLPWKDMTYDQNVEIQRKVLPLMKTNLRLVLVKKTDPS